MALYLRKPKITDEKYFLRWWRNSFLIKNTSGVYEPITQLKKYFRELLKERYNYVIVVGNKIIGHIKIIKKGKKIFGFPIVIGMAKYRNKGFGSQAIKKVMSIGFNKLGYSKALLEVRPENMRAIKVYKSLGFKTVKLIKTGNKFQPELLVMELTKSIYKKNRSINLL